MTLSEKQAEVERRRIGQRFRAVGLAILTWFGCGVVLTLIEFYGGVVYASAEWWAMLTAVYAVPVYVGWRNWPPRE